MSNCAISIRSMCRITLNKLDLFDLYYFAGSEQHELKPGQHYSSREIKERTHSENFIMLRKHSNQPSKCQKLLKVVYLCHNSGTSQPTCTPVNVMYIITLQNTLFMACDGRTIHLSYSFFFLGGGGGGEGRGGGGISCVKNVFLT